MIIATGPVILLTSIADGLGNVAFTGTLLLTVAMGVGVVVYAKRRPAGAPLTWGQAMVGAVYVTIGLMLAFGIVPDRWMAHAQGNLNMRSDAVLAGPGSTGWLKDLPIVVTKASLADIVATMIYGAALVGTVVLWSVWQKRGQNVSDEVEKSSYGRPLVKA